MLERRATEAGETWQEWDALITMRGTAHKRPDVGLRKQRCLLMGVIGITQYFKRWRGPSPLQCTMHGKVSHRRGDDWTAAARWAVAVNAHQTHAPVTQRSFRLLLIVLPRLCRKPPAPGCMLRRVNKHLYVLPPKRPEEVYLSPVGLRGSPGSTERCSRAPKQVSTTSSSVSSRSACPQESWKATL